MMIDATPLFAETLEPRFFSELGLSRQRLLQWFEITGLEPFRADTRKRRQFSPAHVLRLGLLKELKEGAAIPFNEHPSLIAAIGQDQLVKDAFGLWMAGDMPTFVTDADETHRVRPLAHIQPKALMGRSRRLYLYDLDLAVSQTLAAMLRGGSAIQKEYAARATAVHAQALRTKAAKRDLEIDPGIHTEREALAHVLVRLG